MHRLKATTLEQCTAVQHLLHHAVLSYASLVLTPLKIHNRCIDQAMAPCVIKKQGNGWVWVEATNLEQKQHPCPVFLPCFALRTSTTSYITLSLHSSPPHQPTNLLNFNCFCFGRSPHANYCTGLENEIIESSLPNRVKRGSFSCQPGLCCLQLARG